MEEIKQIDPTEIIIPNDPGLIAANVGDLFLFAGRFWEVTNTKKIAGWPCSHEHTLKITKKSQAKFEETLDGKEGREYG